MRQGHRIVIEGHRGAFNRDEICRLAVALVGVLRHVMPDLTVRIEPDDRPPHPEEPKL